MDSSLSFRRAFMKKLFLGVLLITIFSTNILANQIKIFTGYTNNNKERYITWSSAAVAVAMLDFGRDDGAKQVSMYASTCLNDKFWYKAEMLTPKIKHSMYTYKFKFHWLMNSKILYIDVHGSTMNCRK